MTFITKSIKSFIFVITLLFVLGLPSAVNAGGSTFSGSDCRNYSCPRLTSKVNDPESEDYGKTVYLSQREAEGGEICEGGSAFVIKRNQNYYCEYDELEKDQNGDPIIKTTLAIPNPPQLRVIEYWVVRIIYSAWALAGVFFTLVLMWIGFNYITSFGNEVALADVIKKFRYWLIGLILVFLSYPILVTFFQLLPLDTSGEGGDCYSQLGDQLIGFQFFFPQACGTDGTVSYSRVMNSCIVTCEGIAVSNQDQCPSVCASIIRRCTKTTCFPETSSGTPDLQCVMDNCLDSTQFLDYFI